MQHSGKQQSKEGTLPTPQTPVKIPTSWSFKHKAREWWEEIFLDVIQVPGQLILK